MKTNCPNCGAPIDRYKCKCDYCGTWYFDLSAFDFEDGKPCYIRFKTPMGIFSAMATPELRTIDVWEDTVDVMDTRGYAIKKFRKGRHCDFDMTFHTVANPETNTLYTLEVKNE